MSETDAEELDNQAQLLLKNTFHSIEELKEMIGILISSSDEIGWFIWIFVEEGRNLQTDHQKGLADFLEMKLSQARRQHKELRAFRLKVASEKKEL